MAKKNPTETTNQVPVDVNGEPSPDGRTAAERAALAELPPHVPATPIAEVQEMDAAEAKAKYREAAAEIDHAAPMATVQADATQPTVQDVAGQPVLVLPPPVKTLTEEITGPAVFATKHLAHFPAHSDGARYHAAEAVKHLSQLGVSAQVFTLKGEPAVCELWLTAKRETAVA